MKSINEVVESKVGGLFYGNRLLLPFKAHFLKVIIDNKIITDFSPATSGIFINEEDNFTDLYFIDYKLLKDVVTEYEAIKMIVVEKGEDVFDQSNHKKLLVYLKDKHLITIEEADDNILFLD